MANCCGLEYLKLNPEADLEEDDETKKKKELSVKELFSIFKVTWPFLWPVGETGLKVRLVISMSIIFLSKGLNLLVPWAIGQAIFSLQNSPTTVPIAMIMTYGGLKALMSLLKEVQESIFLAVTQNAARLVSTRAFAHLHNLSLRYHLKRKTGAVLRTVQRGQSSYAQMVRITLFTLFPAIVEFFLTLGMLGIAYGWQFTANLFIFIVLYVVVTMVLSGWRRKFRRVSNKFDNKAGEIALDSLINFETVKSFTTEPVEVDRYHKSIVQYQSVEMASRISLLLLNSSQQLCITGGLVASLWLAARDIVAGNLNVGSLVAIQFYLLQVVSPLSWLGSAWEFINSAAMDCENLMEILDEPIDIEDAPNAENLVCDDSNSSIEFDNVSFGYGEQLILRNVSFTVESGKSLAIVGPTGSGKSTIGRLLLRYYDVDSGTIRVAGKEISRVTAKSLRSNVAVVSQDTVLFNQTIAFNIEYGDICRGPVSMDRIKRAAQQAQIADFIENSPDRYETMVGERGLRLSGGEKQRIGIARALLKGSSIWLLDEATSALDTQTENAISETLNEAATSRTTIIIAHRLSTVMKCDEIAVLDKGVIVERGTHNELLAQEGHYYRLWTAQVTAEKGKEEDKAETTTENDLISM